MVEVGGGENGEKRKLLDGKMERKEENGKGGMLIPTKMYHGK